METGVSPSMDPAALDPQSGVSAGQPGKHDRDGRAPIVIVGGGFGGLYTALALAARTDHPPLLLIEPQERFLFLPLLYELLSGELRRWEIAPRYDTLLAGRGVAWLQDRVDRIEADRQLIHTRGGQEIRYSRLVLACGGGGATFGVAGADHHSLAFRSLADVDRLQALLVVLRRQDRPLQRLAIVGAGPTGVELACKLADLVPESCRIELIEQGPQLLPHAKAFNREQAAAALQLRRVTLRTNTAVTAVEADLLRLHHQDGSPGGSDGTGAEEQLPVQAVIWTAGLAFQPPAISPPPPRDGRGRLCCDANLRLKGQSEVFVVGDLAAPELEEGPLPATAQVAFQQAPLLADNLMRSLAGEDLRPFRWNDLGEMLSLGVQEATLCGAGITLAGRTAYRLRQLAYLSRMPGLPHTLKVAAGWLADWHP